MTLNTYEGETKVLISICHYWLCINSLCVWTKLNFYPFENVKVSRNGSNLINILIGKCQKNGKYKMEFLISYVNSNSKWESIACSHRELFLWFYLYHYHHPNTNQDKSQYNGGQSIWLCSYKSLVISLTGLGLLIVCAADLLKVLLPRAVTPHVTTRASEEITIFPRPDSVKRVDHEGAQSLVLQQYCLTWEHPLLSLAVFLPKFQGRRLRALQLGLPLHPWWRPERAASTPRR